jgi:hypothetical protein
MVEEVLQQQAEVLGLLLSGGVVIQERFRKLTLGDETRQLSNCFIEPRAEFTQLGQRVSNTFPQ